MYNFFVIKSHFPLECYFVFKLFNRKRLSEEDNQLSAKLPKKMRETLRITCKHHGSANCKPSHYFESEH